MEKSSISKKRFGRRILALALALLLALPNTSLLGDLGLGTFTSRADAALAITANPSGGGVKSGTKVTLTTNGTDQVFYKYSATQLGNDLFGTMEAAEIDTYVRDASHGWKMATSSVKPTVDGEGYLYAVSLRGDEVDIIDDDDDNHYTVLPEPTFTPNGGTLPSGSEKVRVYVDNDDVNFIYWKISTEEITEPESWKGYEGTDLESYLDFNDTSWHGVPAVEGAIEADVNEAGTLYAVAISSSDHYFTKSEAFTAPYTLAEAGTPSEATISGSGATSTIAVTLNGLAPEGTKFAWLITGDSGMAAYKDTTDPGDAKKHTLTITGKNTATTDKFIKVRTALVASSVELVGGTFTDESKVYHGFTANESDAKEVTINPRANITIAPADENGNGLKGIDFTQANLNKAGSLIGGDAVFNNNSTDDTEDDTITYSVNDAYTAAGWNNVKTDIETIVGKAVDNQFYKLGTGAIKYYASSSEVAAPELANEIDGAKVTTTKRTLTASVSTSDGAGGQLMGVGYTDPMDESTPYIYQGLKEKGPAATIEVGFTPDSDKQPKEYKGTWSWSYNCDNSALAGQQEIAEVKLVSGETKTPLAEIGQEKNVSILNGENTKLEITPLKGGDGKSVMIVGTFKPSAPSVANEKVVKYTFNIAKDTTRYNKVIFSSAPINKDGSLPAGAVIYGTGSGKSSIPLKYVSDGAASGAGKLGNAEANKANTISVYVNLVDKDGKPVEVEDSSTTKVTFAGSTSYSIGGFETSEKKEGETYGSVADNVLTLNSGVASGKTHYGIIKLTAKDPNKGTKSSNIAVSDVTGTSDNYITGEEIPVAITGEYFVTLGLGTNAKAIGASQTSADKEFAFTGGKKIVGDILTPNFGSKLSTYYTYDSAVYTLSGWVFMGTASTSTTGRGIYYPESGVGDLVDLTFDTNGESAVIIPVTGSDYRLAGDITVSPVFKRAKSPEISSVYAKVGGDGSAAATTSDVDATGGNIQMLRVGASSTDGDGNGNTLFQTALTANFANLATGDTIAIKEVKKSGNEYVDLTGSDKALLQTPAEKISTGLTTRTWLIKTTTDAAAAAALTGKTTAYLQITVTPKGESPITQVVAIDISLSYLATIKTSGTGFESGSKDTYKSIPAGKGTTYNDFKTTVTKGTYDLVSGKAIDHWTITRNDSTDITSSMSNAIAGDITATPDIQNGKVKLTFELSPDVLTASGAAISVDGKGTALKAPEAQEVVYETGELGGNSTDKGKLDDPEGIYGSEWTPYYYVLKDAKAADTDANRTQVLVHNDSAPAVTGTKFTADTTIYMTLATEVTITNKGNNSPQTDSDSKVTVVYGHAIPATNLPDKTSTNVNFEGYYAGDTKIVGGATKIDKDLVTTSALTVSAKWTVTYTLAVDPTSPLQETSAGAKVWAATAKTVTVPYDKNDTAKDDSWNAINALIAQPASANKTTGTGTDYYKAGGFYTTAGKLKSDGTKESDPAGAFTKASAMTESKTLYVVFVADSTPRKLIANGGQQKKVVWKGTSEDDRTATLSVKITDADDKAVTTSETVKWYSEGNEYTTGSNYLVVGSKTGSPLGDAWSTTTSTVTSTGVATITLYAKNEWDGERKVVAYLEGTTQKVEFTLTMDRQYGITVNKGTMGETANAVSVQVPVKVDGTDKGNADNTGATFYYGADDRIGTEPISMFNLVKTMEDQWDAIYDLTDSTKEFYYLSMSGTNFNYYDSENVVREFNFSTINSMVPNTYATLAEAIEAEAPDAPIGAEVSFTGFFGAKRKTVTYAFDPKLDVKTDSSTGWQYVELDDYDETEDGKRVDAKDRFYLPAPRKCAAGSTATLPLALDATTLASEDLLGMIREGETNPAHIHWTPKFYTLSTSGSSTVATEVVMGTSTISEDTTLYVTFTTNVTVQEYETRYGSKYVKAVPDIDSSNASAHEKTYTAEYGIPMVNPKGLTPAEITDYAMFRTNQIPTAFTAKNGDADAPELVFDTWAVRGKDTDVYGIDYNTWTEYDLYAPVTTAGIVLTQRWFATVKFGDNNSTGFATKSHGTFKAGSVYSSKLNSDKFAEIDKVFYYDEPMGENLPAYSDVVNDPVIMGSTVEWGAYSTENGDILNNNDHVITAKTVIGYNSAKGEFDPSTNVVWPIYKLKTKTATITIAPDATAAGKAALSDDGLAVGGQIEVRAGAQIQSHDFAALTGDYAAGNYLGVEDKDHNWINLEALLTTESGKKFALSKFVVKSVGSGNTENTVGQVVYGGTNTEYILGDVTLTPVFVASEYTVNFSVGDSGATYKNEAIAGHSELVPVTGGGYTFTGDKLTGAQLEAIRGKLVDPTSTDWTKEFYGFRFTNSEGTTSYLKGTGTNRAFLNGTDDFVMTDIKAVEGMAITPVYIYKTFKVNLSAGVGSWTYITNMNLQCDENVTTTLFTYTASTSDVAATATTEASYVGTFSAAMPVEALDENDLPLAEPYVKLFTASTKILNADASPVTTEAMANIKKPNAKAFSNWAINRSGSTKTLTDIKRETSGSTRQYANETNCVRFYLSWNTATVEASYENAISYSYDLGRMTGQPGLVDPEGGMFNVTDKRLVRPTVADYGVWSISGWYYEVEKTVSGAKQLKLLSDSDAKYYKEWNFSTDRLTSDVNLVAYWTTDVIVEDGGITKALPSIALAGPAAGGSVKVGYGETITKATASTYFGTSDWRKTASDNDYYFVGWNVTTENNGTKEEQEVLDSAESIFTANLAKLPKGCKQAKLTAEWNALVTLSLSDKADATWTGSAQNFYANGNVNSAAPGELTRTVYVQLGKVEGSSGKISAYSKYMTSSKEFIGWFTQASGKGIQFQPDTDAITANQTLYAYFENAENVVTVTVAVDKNGKYVEGVNAASATFKVASPSTAEKSLGDLYLEASKYVEAYNKEFGLEDFSFTSGTKSGTIKKADTTKISAAGEKSGNAYSFQLTANYTKKRMGVTLAAGKAGAANIAYKEGAEAPESPIYVILDLKDPTKALVTATDLAKFTAALAPYNLGEAVGGKKPVYFNDDTVYLVGGKEVKRTEFEKGVYVTAATSKITGKYMEATIEVQLLKEGTLVATNRNSKDDAASATFEAGGKVEYLNGAKINEGQANEGKLELITNESVQMKTIVTPALASAYINFPTAVITGTTGALSLKGSYIYATEGNGTNTVTLSPVIIAEKVGGNADAALGTSFRTLTASINTIQNTAEAANALVNTAFPGGLYVVLNDYYNGIGGKAITNLGQLAFESTKNNQVNGMAGIKADNADAIKFSWATKSELGGTLAKSVSLSKMKNETHPENVEVVYNGDNGTQHMLIPVGFVTVNYGLELKAGNDSTLDASTYLTDAVVDDEVTYNLVSSYTGPEWAVEDIENGTTNTTTRAKYGYAAGNADQKIGSVGQSVIAERYWQFKLKGGKADSQVLVSKNSNALYKGEITLKLSKATASAVTGSTKVTLTASYNDKEFTATTDFNLTKSSNALEITGFSINNGVKETSLNNSLATTKAAVNEAAYTGGFEYVKLDGYGDKILAYRNVLTNLKTITISGTMEQADAKAKLSIASSNGNVVKVKNSSVTPSGIAWSATLEGVKPGQAVITITNNDAMKSKTVMLLNVLNDTPTIMQATRFYADGLNEGKADKAYDPAAFKTLTYDLNKSDRYIRGLHVSVPNDDPRTTGIAADDNIAINSVEVADVLSGKTSQGKMFTAEVDGALPWFDLKAGSIPKAGSYTVVLKVTGTYGSNADGAPGTYGEIPAETVSMLVNVPVTVTNTKLTAKVALTKETRTYNDGSKFTYDLSSTYLAYRQPITFITLTSDKPIKTAQLTEVTNGTLASYAQITEVTGLSTDGTCEYNLGNDANEGKLTFTEAKTTQYIRLIHKDMSNGAPTKAAQYAKKLTFKVGFSGFAGTADVSISPKYVTTQLKTSATVKSLNFFPDMDISEANIGVTAALPANLPMRRLTDNEITYRAVGFTEKAAPLYTINGQTKEYDDYNKDNTKTNDSRTFTGTSDLSIRVASNAAMTKNSETIKGAVYYSDTVYRQVAVPVSIKYTRGAAALKKFANTKAIGLNRSLTDDSGNLIDYGTTTLMIADGIDAYVEDVSITSKKPAAGLVVELEDKTSTMTNGSATVVAYFDPEKGVPANGTYTYDVVGYVGGGKSDGGHQLTGSIKVTIGAVDPDKALSFKQAGTLKPLERNSSSGKIVVTPQFTKTGGVVSGVEFVNPDMNKQFSVTKADDGKSVTISINNDATDLRVKGSYDLSLRYTISVGPNEYTVQPSNYNKLSKTKLSQSSKPKFAVTWTNDEGKQVKGATVSTAKNQAGNLIYANVVTTVATNPYYKLDADGYNNLVATGDIDNPIWTYQNPTTVGGNNQKYSEVVAASDCFDVAFVQSGVTNKSTQVVIRQKKTLKKGSYQIRLYLYSENCANDTAATKQTFKVTVK